MRNITNPIFFKIRVLTLPLLLFIGLGVSFWYYGGWMQLCAGLAMFLFGMQCLEEGMRQLAGSNLEKILHRRTSTPFKGFLFGVAGTAVLQSTTLMSLLTIAFISAGLVQLAGGISILLGINFGATFGIWLLALAGQNFSLSPLAYPLLVFGVLAGFTGNKGKAAGRIVLGIAFVFFGIDEIKHAFSAFHDIDLAAYTGTGFATQLLVLLAIGLILTAILQSSHATIMLIFAALASGQLELWQGMALAIGANIGSSVTTALVGWLGGNRSGQRLATMHVIFNLGSAVLTLILFVPLRIFSQWSIQILGAGNNTLLQLAMFILLFNLLGVILFWPWQNELEKLLIKWVPDRAEPEVLISATTADSKSLVNKQVITTKHVRYLDETALTSVDTAARAVVKELHHLGRLSLEVICHALYQPVEQLTSEKLDEQLIYKIPDDSFLDAEQLYQHYIKGIYSEIIIFMSRFEFGDDSSKQEEKEFWITCQVVALQLVESVKDAKQLQKNLGIHLQEQNSAVQKHYFSVRRHLMMLLRQVAGISRLNLDELDSKSFWKEMELKTEKFDCELREQIFAEIRQDQLNGFQASSLLNDLGYLNRIALSFSNIMQLSGIWQGRPLYAQNLDMAAKITRLREQGLL